jgi:DNA-binding NarL/FixJ family response regulator
MSSSSDVFVSFAAPESSTIDPIAARSLDSLSAREIEVLVLLVRGLTNQEVADLLCLSARTIESHRAALQRKVGVRTRAELARGAYDAGLV